MSERKVLNKYYPPDFDPTKIPKIRRPKNYRPGVFSIRVMAPFNMRCNTCGEYIYKGKKFNSRKETVENETYLGLHIFRFYIKCPRCIAEIAFKTDPQSTDYELEAGATRNFEATRTAEKMALQEQKEKEAEEANNPMKVLENRTKASCQEIQMLETLEDLRELRHRHARVDTEKMLQQNKEENERLLALQEEEDEKFVRSVFGTDGSGIVMKRLNSDEESSADSDDESIASSSGRSSIDAPLAKVPRTSDNQKPTDLLIGEGSVTTAALPGKCAAGVPVWSRSVGTMKCQLTGLVRPKTTATSTVSSSNNSTAATRHENVIQWNNDGNDEGCTEKCEASELTSLEQRTSGSGVVSTGLAGLGAYSSTSGSSDNDESG